MSQAEQETGKNSSTTKKWQTELNNAEAELNKIVDGDVAKWNGVAADHLTAADKATLEDAIKEAKKAGTDAAAAAKAAQEYGFGYNLVAGANIAGFLKVAEAMKAQGCV